MDSGMHVEQEGDISERRSANYKPNIWKREFIQSLASRHNDEMHKRLVEKLREEVKQMFDGNSVLSKLELVNDIQKLGLAYLYDKEIKTVLQDIASSNNTSSSKDKMIPQDDIYIVALRFRLFRQHGFEVSQDMFCSFMDEKGKFVKNKYMNKNGLIELYEASNLGFEGENILDDAKEFASKTLREIYPKCEYITHIMNLPTHMRVPWFNVRWCINTYEKKEEERREKKNTLLKLAKLHYNMVQAGLQDELREISLWWANLGLIENMSFARDRVVECFMCTVGLVFQPQHKMFRKWLTKLIVFILIVDDVYDVYGSLEELKQFTHAIDRWDLDEVEQLPNCMKKCFETLHQTVNATAREIEQQNGWDHVSPLLQKTWADFGKALLGEAKWYTEGKTPLLDEYLENGCVSSSSPLIYIHSLLAMTRGSSRHSLDNHIQHQLLHNLSLIIRLSNDLGTSKAEGERGDSPSSINCYQRANGVTETEAETHIKTMVQTSWKTLNKLWFCNLVSPSMQPFLDVTTNVVRVAMSLYQYGDGFGVQDRETRRNITSLLIEPFDTLDYGCVS